MVWLIRVGALSQADTHKRVILLACLIIVSRVLDRYTYLKSLFTPSATVMNTNFLQTEITSTAPSGVETHPTILERAILYHQIGSRHLGIAVA